MYSSKKLTGSVARRYEKGALILTSNQTYSHWGEVFGDHVLATAILDRLLHHAVSINIKGESYRLKEKLKAGSNSRSNFLSSAGFLRSKKAYALTRALYSVVKFINQG